MSQRPQLQLVHSEVEPAERPRVIALANSDEAVVEDRLAGRLQRLLERFPPDDLERQRHIVALLPRVRRPRVLWLLLAWLDRAPFPHRDAEVVFDAVRRLTRAQSVRLRSAAYRWLAVLHRRDLRFEARARRELRQARARESGLVRARIRQLLQTA